MNRFHHATPPFIAHWQALSHLALPTTLVGFLLFTIGCLPSPSEPPSSSPPKVTLAVAASTQDLITDLESSWKQELACEWVVTSGGSNQLAAQILQGAPVHLFISASPRWSQAIVDANLASAHQPWLANTLVLASASSDPLDAITLDELLSDRVRNVAIAGPDVPAGTYAEQALRKLNLYQPLLDAKKLIRGHDVRSVASYLQSHEAHVGFLYATDPKAFPSLKILHQVDPSHHDPIVYTLTRTKLPSNAADRIFQELTSERATPFLERHGFLRSKPSPPHAN